MINFPKISVVTISYGQQNYITQTLDGVFMQDYPGEIEFIIANDNSPDQTDEVVKDYLINTKIPCNFNIKYTNHAANKGMMLNFIWALEQATGKYIALCEGDDYWTDPLKLRKQSTFLEANPDFICCYHKAKIMCPDGKTIPDYIISRPEAYDNLEAIIRSSNTIFTPSVIFRNHIIDFPDEFERSPIGDVFLFYLLAEKGKIKFVDKEMCVYRLGVGVFSPLSDYQKHFITVQFLVLFYQYLNKKNKLPDIQIFITKRIFEFFKKFNPNITDTDFIALHMDYGHIKKIIDNYQYEGDKLMEKSFEAKTWCQLFKILFMRMQAKFRITKK